jgi:N4-gp56 family major capsid protein
MAETRFLTNDNLTRKKWSRDLFAVILPAVEFNSLVGKGKNEPIQIKTELGKGEGDQITFGIRLPLTGEGEVGYDTVEGNEEKLIFRNFNMTIEELNHAVDTGGKMDQQRVPYDLAVEGKDGLQEWWSDKLSDYIINGLAGNSAFRIAGQIFANAISEPDSDHHLFMNGVAEASQTAADEMDLTFLDAMKQRAEMPTGDAFKVRPLIRGGKKYYKVILHTYVYDRLRQNTNVAQWGDLLRAANKLQEPNIEFEYNGMMVMKSERIPQVQPNVYRNVLVGAQAGCWAWGGAGESKSSVMAFIPYTRDAKRFLMFRGGGIFGFQKVTFASLDYGVIAGSSFATALQS